MSIQSLPLEIGKIVVGLLPKKDQSSISLVSAHFLALARPILFSSIRLPRVVRHHNSVRTLEATSEDNDRNLRDYRDFLSFLDSNPALSVAVCNLTLWETGSLSVSGETIDIVFFTLEILDAMIQKLPSLRSLWLHNIRFTLSDTAVPYRYESIDRVTISQSPSAVLPADIIRSLSLFSHIGDLSLHSPFLPADPSSVLKVLRDSDVLFFDWKVDNIHIEHSDVVIGRRECQLGFWTEIFRLTRTPQVLRSFSIQRAMLTAEFYPTSPILDFLHAAAPTLTHLTLGTSYHNRVDPASTPWYGDGPDAHRQFDSHAMRMRLASLTSLRSLTLKFGFDQDISQDHDDMLGNFMPYVRSEAFAHMVPLLASFPTCLRTITFSFAYPKPQHHLIPGFWLWPDLNLRPLVPLLRRYDQLEVVMFEGADGTTVEEMERILNDLPEMKQLIRFVESR